MPNSFPSGVGTFFTAANQFTTISESGVQCLLIDLDNTYDATNKQVLARIYQKYVPSSGEFHDLDLTQKLVIGAWVSNPLELTSKKTADQAAGTNTGATGVSYIRANNFISYSDVRLKTNIETLNEEQGVDKIRVVQYNSIGDNSKHFGVIAHELGEIYPELVSGEKGQSQMQSVSYVELIPLCINEIQRMKKENRSLLARLDAIEKKLAI